MTTERRCVRCGISAEEALEQGEPICSENGLVTGHSYRDLTCWLAQFSEVPCSGRLVRAHLLPQQTLRRELGTQLGARAAADPRSYVLACGGDMGLGGHHALLDSHRLRIPRESLPEGLVALCEELGLSWYLDRRFGAQGA